METPHVIVANLVLDGLLGPGEGPCQTVPLGQGVHLLFSVFLVLGLLPPPLGSNCLL